MPKINFPNKLEPWQPIYVIGPVFADDNEELWCFDTEEMRVYHIGAEIEMRISEMKDYDNGYEALTLKEAIEIVKGAT